MPLYSKHVLLVLSLERTSLSVVVEYILLDFVMEILLSFKVEI